MTRKDFIALANVLRQTEPQSYHYNWEPKHIQWEKDRDSIASFLQSHNPNFNRSRWLAYIAGETGSRGGKVKMRQFKTLYGIRVPTPKYEELKQVADVLARQTFTNLKIGEARRLAVELALESFVKMTKGGKRK